jgi:hypothetical protein
MDTDLKRYLSDHLAGSAGAIMLLDELIERIGEPEEEEFFHELKSQIEADQEFLKGLLAAIGSQPGPVAKAAGNFAARVSFLKLMWEGLEPGKLGMFEALEMLSLGIHGKRLLWLALREVACWFPEWECIDFASLELDAIRQRDELERWRLEAARETLASARRRASAETLV